MGIHQPPFPPEETSTPAAASHVQVAGIHPPPWPPEEAEQAPASSLHIAPNVLAAARHLVAEAGSIAAARQALLAVEIEEHRPLEIASARAGNGAATRA
ncbi:MAG TPA: hypothetical protein VMF30_05010 [Pirellulales bacterium]|nr:hypothetical protein [Pirellulales bacterium]